MRVFINSSKYVKFTNKIKIFIQLCKNLGVILDYKILQNLKIVIYLKNILKKCWTSLLPLICASALSWVGCEPLLIVRVAVVSWATSGPRDSSSKFAAEGASMRTGAELPGIWGTSWGPNSPAAFCIVSIIQYLCMVRVCHIFLFIDFFWSLSVLVNCWIVINF